MANGNSNSLKPVVPMLPFPMPNEGAPPPPPFQPGAPVDVSDLEARIAALLQPESSPAPQPMGFTGVLRNLLAALPQAISVGLSKDPGEALTNQLREMRAMQFQREQREQARKDKLEDLRRQVGIDLARGEIEQRREVGREGRRYQQQVALTQQEQAFRTGERQAEAESRFRLAELDQRGREALQQAQFANAKELALMNFENDVQLKSVQTALGYAAMGMDGAKAYDLAKRVLSGKSTAADQKALSEMHAREFGQIQKERGLQQRLTLSQIRKNEADVIESHARAAAARASGSSGLNGEMAKVFFKGLEDAIKTPTVVLADGTVTDRTGLSVIDQANVVKTLSQEENIQRYMNGPGKLLLAGLAKGFSQNQVVTGPAKEVVAKELDTQIKAFRKQKMPDNKIVEGLLEYGKANNRQQDAVDAIIRNGLEKVGKQVIEADIKRIGAGGKVNQLPTAKPAFQSSIGGTGIIPRALRSIEQGMVDASNFLEERSKPSPPAGFDPRTRRPIGENPRVVTTDAKPLGLLPEFQPGLQFRHTEGAKPLGLLPEPPNPGSIGRGIEALVSGQVQIAPTGNLSLDLLLEQLGLIPQGSAAQAQVKR